ncbi:MAG: PQQ-binding-like beta-propeller repeat protein [Acidobacteria bacterium]|nr:PQQ-binding-like beta-propeller repeat protein [Acidobacteriota bacterium]
MVRFVLLLILMVGVGCAENWPQWRGPSMDGASAEKGLPTKWSTEEGVTWKLALPGRSGATPIIWNDHVFLNVADGDDLQLWDVDRATGKLRWKQKLAGGNYKINKQNMSSPSPVTDGKTVFVMTGVGIFKAFDFTGKELWTRDIQKDYGKFGLNWGYASSPLLWGGSLYVQVLHGMKTDDPSYLLRIDPKSGKTLVRVERATNAVVESPDSYTTPQIWKDGKQEELIITGGDVVTGHDPGSLKELWRANVLNPGNNPMNRIIASAVVKDGLIYCPTRVKPLTALRPGGRGDVTATHVVWQNPNGPDVPSPVTDGKYLFVANDRGILWCLDAKTGKEIWGGQRIKAAIYSASPVLADGKLYVTSEDGLVTVVKAGPQFEVLAENDMKEYTLSSPAISDGQIFIRTAGALYAIGARR